MWSTQGSGLPELRRLGDIVDTMRVLIIRHTETESNVGMQGEGYVKKKKLMTNEEILERDELRHLPAKRDFSVRPMLELERIGEDIPTETGVEMTHALAEYWEPVLRPYVERGLIEFVVSPTFRTQLTVDPLVRALKKHGDFPCTLMPELCEIPCPNHVDDMKVKAPIERLLLKMEHATDEAEKARFREEATALLEAAEERGWTPAGMTGRQIRETGIDLRGEKVSFPWVELPEGWPLDEGWCVYGPEDSMLEPLGVRKTTRFRKVRDWLHDIKQDKKINDIVVLVAHGGSIGRIIEELLNDGSGTDATGFSYHNHDNTSCCSIQMYPDSDALRSAGVANTIAMEFMNRIDHLYKVDPRFGSRLGAFFEFEGMPNAGGVQPAHGEYYMEDYRQRKAEYEAMQARPKL